MPSITGKVTGWTKGPPRGFTVTDERTPPTTVVIADPDLSDLDFLTVVTCKGDGQRVTINYTNHAGPPPYNTLDQIRSAP